MKKLYLFLLCLCFAGIQGKAQQKTNPDSIKQKMQWFADAKLGIFIHWGIYAVNGIDESWSFHNKKISYADYMKQMDGFTARNYDPQQWADLINESGAKYAVITTKHHDGVALWPTKQKHFNVVKNTPAKRDLLKPFYEALDKHGIKKGAYFSLIDWSYPDYPGFLKDSSRYKVADNPQRWQRFQRFYQAQINEVNTAYKPDLWWFDGDWEHSAAEWQCVKVRTDILSLKPQAILNGRLQGYGDYDTPEQNFPVSRPKFHWWELCMTTNNNWGYHPDDTNYKTPFEVISIFTDAISNGGNLLLDIGPDKDGNIPTEQVHILKELGKWTKKHQEAIYGTLAGLPQGHFYGASTLSKDSTTVYLFLPGQTTGNIMVKGLDNKIKDIQVVGTQEHLSPKIVGKVSWSPIPGIVFINVPDAQKDQYMTVLKLSLNEPLKLYRGQGGLN
ncbi:alpha-L-fucosidase [Solitalea canadensis]|uniref:alpha-L-fucosidase n=1 Tax=Solitalea canadensis (strain ATCC 29591 / DSM 3403 / JCM 21819 / LMG 8368 / NBRC 15130 / NCIMB 12057 / USAM 9D) TaxID=929556 RepID=H8KVU4_SOLCM|nr:alpha-L-fucosidase [Solitalea canadensis]AFD06717.1 alpha-L-fucosidase [Solitalea canadensis DSM 3403]